MCKVWILTLYDARGVEVGRPDRNTLHGPVGFAVLQRRAVAYSKQSTLQWRLTASFTWEAEWPEGRAILRVFQ